MQENNNKTLATAVTAYASRVQTNLRMYLSVLEENCRSGVIKAKQGLQRRRKQYLHCVTHSAMQNEHFARPRLRRGYILAGAVVLVGGIYVFTEIKGSEESMSPTETIVVEASVEAPDIATWVEQSTTTDEALVSVELMTERFSARINTIDTVTTEEIVIPAKETLQASETMEEFKKVETATEDVDTTQEVITPRGSMYSASEEDSDEFHYYIPVITLDYSWEHMELPYEHQLHLWNTCVQLNMKDYYWLMLGVMARESRFEEDPENYLGKPYFGYMGVGYETAKDISKWLGLDYTLDVHDPYDNITLGVATHAHHLEKLNNEEYAALWAYGTGIKGYYDAIESGEWRSDAAEKAYKYRDMLKDEELNPRQPNYPN